MATAIPWTFKTWLANFKGVDLPIGDLADDVARDLNFPDSEDYETLRTYLERRSGNRKVLDAFKVTWDFYKASS